MTGIWPKGKRWGQVVIHKKDETVQTRRNVIEPPIYFLESRSATQFKEELFHLAMDPNEQHDLIDEKPEIASEMREQMRAFIETLPIGKGGVVQLTPEGNERLRSLGYLR